jgi:hypothetical protein
MNNKESLIGGIKEVGAEVNTEKAKYMLMSRHQNAGQNRNIMIVNRCFENVARFRYLGTTVINRNLIQGEIKRTLKSGNACYHSTQNLLSSRLLSTNIKVGINKAIILPLILYECEVCSLALRQKCIN